MLQYHPVKRQMETPLQIKSSFTNVQHILSLGQHSQQPTTSKSKRIQRNHKFVIQLYRDESTHSKPICMIHYPGRLKLYLKSSKHKYMPLNFSNRYTTMKKWERTIKLNLLLANEALIPVIELNPSIKPWIQT